METTPTRDSDRWYQPSPRLLAMRRAEIAVLALVAGLCMLPLASAGGTALGLGYGALVVVAVGCELLAARRYASWGYCERSLDLLVRRGLLVKRMTVVPYGRMQLVDVTSGAAERVFGLATIRLHTAAASSDARIPGLVPGEAARLRDQLAALGEAQATGV